MACTRPAFVLLAVLCLLERSHGAQQYLGKFLGKLSELHHGVSGEIYAVDARTLHLKDFTYDGEGPAAYFWAGTTRSPGAAGFRVRDENGSGAVLKRYRRKSITLTLPDGKTLNNIKWFSVWCEEFAVNFGDVKIPRNFDYPKPQKIGVLQGVHGVSSDNIVIVDAQTLLIPNFSYDGEAPDAKFWVGTGSKPSPQGLRIPDENGKTTPLRRYDRKTVVLTLPGELTVFDIGHFGVWCEAFTVDFGHVVLPQQLNVPPSLKMLGVSPQSKLNCEVLYDDLAFEVRWAVAGESIVLQLVAKLEDGEYMSFGLSGDNSKNQMIGGDVVVAWVDRSTLKGYAQDYFLEAKSQCSGPRGSCPDERIADNTNNIRLLNAAMVNGYSIVTYQRPLKASDELDLPIYNNRSQAVIWAVGPLNQRQEVSFHSTFSKKDTLLDFGRPAKWNCPMPEVDSAPQQTVQATATRRRQEITTEEIKEVPTTEVTRSRGSDRRRGGNRGTTERSRGDDRTAARRRGGSATTTLAIPTPKPVSKRNAWYIPPIECYEPEDGVFYAQMGPTGGKRGYPAITGHVGWGISWYINGLLIPEINVVRGKTYYFVTEGGEDPEIPAKYHPFYITDDPIGGYEYKTPEERQNVRIFAGVKTTKDGKTNPIGVGRLCHWTHTGDKDADDYPSFGAFQRSLELRCDVGEPGAFQWTPDANTPDTVYYQCFTHRYLGWKINVLDNCDEPAASAPEPVLALPEHGDLYSDSSIIVETRVKPNDLFQTTHSKPDHGKPDHDLEEDVGHDRNQFKSSPEILFLPDNSYPSYTTSTSIPFSTTPVSSSTTIRSTTRNTTNVKSSTTVPPNRKPPQFHGPPKPMPIKPFYMEKPFIRRPVPVMLPHRPPFYKPNFMRYPPPFFGPYKKPYHRVPMRKRPVRISPQKTEVKNNTRQNVENVSTTTEKINNTEIFSSELIYVNKETSNTLKPAVNTGFHPESVVIEGGFKPIITKEIQDRISDESELDLEDDIGVIDLSKKSDPIQPFEPMFIPSPPDSLQKKNLSKLKPALKKKPNLMLIVKHVARSAEFEDQFDNEDDEIAMAQERVETYYLPPDNKKIKPVERVRKPSNIDIPPGSVVTFDGKTVSGISLTTPLEPAFQSRSSKVSEILRHSPQFGPFQGEIPPLETKNINLASLPQLNSQAVLNRDLNAPAAPPTSNSNLQTTRLNPVRSK